MKKSEDKLRKYGFVLASEYRKKIVCALLTPRTPKQISKQTGIYLSHVSKTLTELMNEGIVRCVNPDMKKGRVYNLTELGKWVASKLSQ
ncbi:MAG: winged helix-turn-helix domain-containing protein [Nitrososphaerota archaeon]